MNSTTWVVYQEKMKKDNCHQDDKIRQPKLIVFVIRKICFSNIVLGVRRVTSSYMCGSSYSMNVKPGLNRINWKTNFRGITGAVL